MVSEYRFALLQALSTKRARETFMKLKSARGDKRSLFEPPYVVFFRYVCLFFFSICCRPVLRVEKAVSNDDATSIKVKFWGFTCHNHGKIKKHALVGDAGLISTTWGSLSAR